MIVYEHASEFMIYVLSQEADLGSRVRLTLAQSQYEAFFFADMDEMVQRVKITPPHIIVVDHHALIIELSQFFDTVLGISSEIKMIVLTEVDHFAGLLEFRKFNLVGFLDRNCAGVQWQVL